MKKLSFLLIILAVSSHMYGRQSPQLIIPYGHTGIKTSIKYSEDGKYILTTSTDHTAILWDAETGKTLQQLTGHVAPVTCGAFNANTTMMATGGQDYVAINKKNYFPARNYPHEILLVSLIDNCI